MIRFNYLLSLLLLSNFTQILTIEDIEEHEKSQTNERLATETRNVDKSGAYKLKSPVLKLIDGVPGIMDEHTIHKTLYIGQEVTKFMHGITDKKTKEKLPQHKFNNHLYTLKQLVKIEKEYLSKYSNLKQTNSSQYKKTMEPLKESLKVAKTNFQRITDPFLKDARGSKQQMVELIKESCKLRNRMTSKLLTWSESSERDSFNKNIKTFHDLDVFCLDLTNFLKDLINSCPKAYKKFLAWKQHNKK